MMAQWLKPGFPMVLLTGALTMSALLLPEMTHQGQAQTLASPDLTAMARTMPASVQRKLLQQVSQDTKVPTPQLKVVAARPQVWDGCLGVAGPLQPCTMIAISGWQVIVTGPKQYWVYHLNQTASLIKQNPTTSGVGTIVPIFWQPEPYALTSSISDNVLFQSITSGGLAGVRYRTVLLRDGQVLRSEIRGNTLSVPMLVRRLSPQQVQAFLQTLRINEFEDFLGFNYPANRGADYFTIALMVPYGRQGVQYADLIQAETPSQLQQVIQAWDQISRPASQP